MSESPIQATVPEIPAELEHPIKTQRLLLTPLVKGDADALTAVLIDPELYTYIGNGGFPADEDELRATLHERFRLWEKRRSPDDKELWLNWTLRLAVDGTAIGYVQSTIRNGGVASLGYIVGTTWQGQGFAKESVAAMKHAIEFYLGISKFKAETHPENIASQHVAAAIGLYRLPDGPNDDGEEVWANW